jgi:flavin reductase (DIM6/NTAB) family NADH-FMN oxidoreductase RutF
MMVYFICPRPVALVSVLHEGLLNVFPMNLMGPLGHGYFAFALNSLRQAAPLVERAGRIALSIIPIEQFGLARQLGNNHRQQSVNCSQLPFPTKRSPAFGFPVPCMALQTKEMTVELVQRMGTHTLFVARVVSDRTWTEGRQACMIHGIYQAWRQQNSPRLQTEPWAQ